MLDDAQTPNELDWQKACEAAEREFEPTKLILRPGAADEAIFLRLQQVTENLFTRGISFSPNPAPRPS
jgi:hypothetical protein